MPRALAQEVLVDQELIDQLPRLNRLHPVVDAVVTGVAERSVTADPGGVVTAVGGRTHQQRETRRVAVAHGGPFA